MGTRGSPWTLPKNVPTQPQNTLTAAQSPQQALLVLSLRPKVTADSGRRRVSSPGGDMHLHKGHPHLCSDLSPTRKRPTCPCNDSRLHKEPTNRPRWEPGARPCASPAAPPPAPQSGRQARAPGPLRVHSVIRSECFSP